MSAEIDQEPSGSTSATATTSNVNGNDSNAAAEQRDEHVQQEGKSTEETIGDEGCSSTSSAHAGGSKMVMLSPRAPTDARCSFGHALFRSDLPENAARMSKDKNVRKMLKIRETRRSAGITHEFFPLDCDEENLSEVFSQQYSTLLSRSVSPVECYHIITNSLTRFFSDKTWSNDVETMVADFIEKCVLKSHEELCKIYDADESDCLDKRLLDYEVNALLEMHLLRLKPKPLDSTALASKIRIINYMADFDRMKKFVDEGITDLFSLMLPLYVTGLHEELSLDIPCDLEEFESAEHKMHQDLNSSFNGTFRFEDEHNEASEDGDSERSGNLRRSQRGQAGVELLSGDFLPKISRKRKDNNFSMNEETKMAVAKMHDELYDGIGDDGNDENVSKISRRRSSRNIGGDKKSPSGDGQGHVKKEVLRTPTRAPKKARRSFVPETPDEKIRVKKEEDIYEDEVVKQTPAGKLRSRRDKDAAKYRELLKQTEASAARSEARVRTAFNSPALSEVMSGGTPVISRRTLLNNSPAKAGLGGSTVKLRSSAKVNLRDRFAALQKESSSSSASSKPKAETTSKFGITTDIVDGYAEKISSLCENANAIDSDTIFYGRNATHENLFQKEDDKNHEAAAQAAPVATTRRTQQKNRSGRSVTAANCINMAHVLLNVDNTNPESCARPQKQESPFKMRKLLRHNTSTRKRAAAARSLQKSPKKMKIDPDAVKQEVDEV